MPPTYDDELAAWMRAANAGDQAAYRRALERIARLLRTRVRHGLARLGRGPEDVEDIVQEALLAVHLKRQTWETNRPVEPWVAAIARYKLVDHLRRRGFHSHVDIDEVADTLSAAPDEGAVAIDRDHLLSGLPERQRHIVEAFSMEGLSAREVSVRMGMTEGAVRVALHRALKRMARGAREGDV